MTVIKHYKNQIIKSLKGFSLIELIVMIALLGLLAAVASTRIKDISINIRVSAAINQITSDLALTKEMALANHKSMSITFDENLNSYIVRQDGNVMTNYPGSNDGIINISEGTFVGVEITDANINGSNILNIDKWGNVLNNGAVTLNGTHIIEISRLTGHWEITNE